MKLIIVKDHEEMSRLAADMINQQIKARPASVLGLATGATPERTYELLAEANQQKKTDWSKVVTFNLDEYVGIPEDHEASYHKFMRDKLFKHVNIKLENTNVPDGNGNLKTKSAAYEKKIAAAGGIDLQLLGIGENGHIAFNEPGSKGDGRTQKVALTESTINANSQYFKKSEEVPRFAVSLGIGTILEAKKIILLASGPKKAHAIRSTVDGSVSEWVPASFLQNHKDVTIIADEAAAKLTRQYREMMLCHIDN